MGNKNNKKIDIPKPVRKKQMKFSNYPDQSVAYSDDEIEDNGIEKQIEKTLIYGDDDNFDMKGELNRSQSMINLRGKTKELKKKIKNIQKENENIYKQNNLNFNKYLSSDDQNENIDLDLDKVDFNNEIVKSELKYELKKKKNSIDNNCFISQKIPKTNANNLIEYYNNQKNNNNNKINNNNINNNNNNNNNNNININNNNNFNNINNNNNNNINNNNINNINNNNLKNENERIIPQKIYNQINKNDLNTILKCLEKCNNKYQEAINLYNNVLYYKSLDVLIKTRASYLKLNYYIQEKKSFPKEFQNIMSLKIGEKVSKINNSINQVSPLAAKQRNGLNKYIQNIKNQKHNNLNNNINTNLNNNLNNNIIQKNNIINPNQNINKIQNLKPNNNINTTNNINNINNINNFNLKPQNQNFQNNNNLQQPSTSSEKENPSKKKKSIHDIEEDEMDSKITSEIMSSSPGVKFSDIIGMKDLKQMINEIIIIPSIRPDLFTGVLKPQRGILLFGPPGTGKTMVAKAIASECSSTFFNISASSLTSKWVGESEKTVRSLFKLAYKKSPSIIFIDEIDSILSKRSENDNEAAKRLKTEFLIQFDGLGSNSNAKLLVIAATNRPMDLDDALLRRLPKRVYCPPLDENGRFEFIKKLISSVDNNLKDNEIKDIAKRTHGYSNADLQELCREAAYEPVRELSLQEILKIKKFRDICYLDLKKATKKIRGTLSLKVVKELQDWNNQFGGI